MKDIIFDPPTKFDFKCADYVPFKDREVCERLRKLSGKELEKHPNPDFNIKVMLNPHPVLIATLFSRLKAASEAGKKYTMILGNPEPETYIPLAQLINYFKVDCSKLHIFAMDEWADDQGNIAPETYEAGFAHSMLKYFVYQIDEKLRMPMENVHYPTNANIDEWLNMEARIVTLHPLTVAQNSLHGVFGQSGYIQSVPPKAATIGPVDVKNARERIEVHALLTNNTFSSWQRMTSRLVLHGPVCPQIPSSMLQLMKTQVYVSEEIAAPFECWEKVGY